MQRLGVLHIVIHQSHGSLQGLGLKGRRGGGVGVSRGRDTGKQLVISKETACKMKFELLSAHSHPLSSDTSPWPKW